MPKSLSAENVLEHVLEKKFDALELLLSKDEDGIEENENFDLSVALLEIAQCKENDLAKKLINKIDLEALTESQSFEMLWSIGNSRFAEVFDHLIDHGLNPASVVEGEDVFYQITKQSAEKEGDYGYAADCIMVKKLLKSEKVQGFVEKQDIASALIQLQTQGPRSLNRSITKNDLPGIQQESWEAKRTSSKANSEENPPAKTSARPGSQPASKLGTKENEGGGCLVS